MKTALVTGLSGFIGRHLDEALSAAGWAVRGLLTTGILERTPEAVVHLATNAGRHGEPAHVVAEDNVVCPLQLLENTIRRQVPVFLNADTALSPDSRYLQAYALSKRHFAEWGMRLCEGTATRFINLRLFWVYGPGDRPGKFVPDLLAQCVKSTGDIPLTPGEQERDFLYVTDAVAAMWWLLEHPDELPEGGTTLECGSGTAVTVRTFAELAHRLARSRATLQFGALAYRPGEVMRYQANPSFLRSRGWDPGVSLEEGVAAILREDFGR